AGFCPARVHWSATFRRRTACGLRTGVIIPLGPESLRNSSGLPEGYNGPGQPSPPIWPCTTRGLPCLKRCRPSGGLLPHRFTLALYSLPVKDEPKVFLQLVIEAFAVRSRLPQAAPAVYFLWPCPWPRPGRPDPLALPGALPFSPTSLDVAPRCPDLPPSTASGDAAQTITGPAREGLH